MTKIQISGAWDTKRDIDLFFGLVCGRSLHGGLVEGWGLNAALSAFCFGGSTSRMT